MECPLLTQIGLADVSRRRARPRNKTLCLQCRTHRSTLSNALATRSNICIRRQIEVHPVGPIRHDEKMNIGNRVITPHKIFVASEILIEMRKSCLEPGTKDVFRLFRYSFVEQRRETALVHLAREEIQ